METLLAVNSDGHALSAFKCLMFWRAGSDSQNRLQEVKSEMIASRVTLRVTHELENVILNSHLLSDAISLSHDRSATLRR